MTPYQYVHQNPINLIDPTGMSADGWIEQEKDGNTTVTHDWRVNTKEEAIAAGYQNVTQVHESGTVDGFYNLNTDGTVCTTDGSCIDWQRSGNQIMSSFVTESQTEIQTDEFNTYQAATGPSVFSPPPGSGRITSIGGIGDIFGFKEMIFGEVATATNNPYAGVILGVASKGKSSGSLGATQKLSKVGKSKTVESIGGKYTKTTEVRPGKGPGQSRAEYIRYKNERGKVIKTYKDSYDRANKWQGRKPLRGGPEGRPAN